MSIRVNYTLADGRTLSLEEIGHYLAAIEADPQTIASMDKQVAAFLANNQWITALATQMQAGNMRIRLTGQGLTPTGAGLLMKIRGA